MKCIYVLALLIFQQIDLNGKTLHLLLQHPFNLLNFFLALFIQYFMEKLIELHILMMLLIRFLLILLMLKVIIVFLRQQLLLLLFELFILHYIFLLILLKVYLINLQEFHEEIEYLFPLFSSVLYLLLILLLVKYQFIMLYLKK